MYEDLISSLRLCRQILHEDDKCIEFVDGGCEKFPVCAYQLMEKAADAIESTSKAYQMMSEAYEAEVTKQVWIPVTERLPEKNGSYLVYIYGEVTEMNCWHGKWHRLGDYTKAVTHWMPLPSAPKPEDGE